MVEGYPTGEQSQMTEADIECCVARWQARLHVYRSPVLFLWEALVFRSPVFHGVVVWLCANLLVFGVTSLEGSAVYQTGSLLLMTALGYALLSAALKYGHVQLHPEWNTDLERQFSTVCRHLALVEQLTMATITTVIDTRKTNPKKFYLVGFLVVLVVGKLGNWVSMALVLQLLVCLLLLFPPALEHGWLSDTTFDNLGSTLQSHFSVTWQLTKLLIVGAHRKLREAWGRLVQARMAAQAHGGQARGTAQARRTAQEDQRQKQ